MKVRMMVDAEFPDKWAESEIRADVIAAITSSVFDHGASQVTLTRLED